MPMTITSSTTAVAYVLSMCRPSLESTYMCTESVRTVFHIVLPSAVPGILSGVILAIGRVVGESAALMYTAGSVAQMPGQAGGGLFDSVRTLSVHMYVLSSEGLHIDKTYATAVVLLVIVIGINALSSFVAKKITKKQG